MTTPTFEQLQSILEAALMVAGRPLTAVQMQKLFDEGQEPELANIKSALNAVAERYLATSGVELKELASGYQFQAKTEFSQWLAKLWEERPQRYSRALLETLALIAYRQPITRAEVEEIRGVTVSSHITKTLQEREWIKIIGYRDIPGKPALYGTTKAFLDHFNLKSLDELPTLAELNNLEDQEAKLQVQLELSSDNLSGTTKVNTSEKEPSDSIGTTETKSNEPDIQDHFITDEMVETSIDPEEFSTTAHELLEKELSDSIETPATSVRETESSELKNQDYPVTDAIIGTSIDPEEFSTTTHEPAGKEPCDSVDTTEASVNETESNELEIQGRSVIDEMIKTATDTEKFTTTDELLEKEPSNSNE